MNSRQSRQSKKLVRKSPRLVLLYLVSFSIPVLFFLLLEGLLRAVGFGHNNELFISNPANKQYLLPQPEIMNRYFPFSSNKPQVTMDTDFFLKDKPSEEIRIFVQGGSTAAGFPYGLGASFAGLLEQRFRRSLPQHQVEVVNTAMSAVNSFTLLDLADEIIEQSPDAVFIYAGHNEFLGILGANANFTHSNSYWLTRLKLALKDLRLFQLTQWLYAQIQTNSAPENTSAQNGFREQRATMMAQVASNQSIAYNSKSYKAGIEQFERNLNALLAKYQSADIPVFISSIASNYQHQKPFSSVSTNQKTSQLLQELATAPNADAVQQASKIIMQSESANAHFEFASIALKAQLPNVAKNHFEWAIKYDLLKFRAPTEMNTLIRQVAARHKAIYVDGLAELEARSTNKIVGNNFMLEHLHPNLQGYFVLANAFYQSFAQNLNILDLKKDEFAFVAIEQAWSKRLVLPSEEYYGFATVKQLMADYPFTNTPKPLILPQPADSAQQLGLDYFNKKMTWLEMMQGNLDYYQGTNKQDMVTKTLLILADAMPHSGIQNFKAGERMHKLNENALAIHYYKRAKAAGLIQPNVDELIAKLRP